MSVSSTPDYIRPEPQPKNPAKGFPLGGKSNATPFGSKTVRFVAERNDVTQLKLGMNRETSYMFSWRSLSQDFNQLAASSHSIPLTAVCLFVNSRNVK